jgi:peroxiredoxin Q/BCP
MPRVGQPAPDFTLPSSQGGEIRLKNLRGRKVVLYFYPADETPTCTQEACSFRDSFALLQRKGAVVLGVSADSIGSHTRFASNHSLPFPLLSDERKKVCQAYGVWKRKQMFGRTYMGIERTTFVIDERGKVKRIFRKVRVKNHVKEVLGALEPNE